jgi:hypothetical protein
LTHFLTVKDRTKVTWVEAVVIRFIRGAGDVAFAVAEAA